MKVAIFSFTAFVVLLNDAIGVVFFSAIGMAPTVSNAMASSRMNMFGNIAGCVVAFYLGLLFVLDFHLRSAAVQIPMGALLIVLFYTAAVLKCIGYPWVPGLLCLVLPVVFVGIMRATRFNRKVVAGKDYFTLTSIAFLISGIIVLGVWAVWLFTGDRLWSDETKLWITTQNDKVFEYVWPLDDEGGAGSKLVYTSHCISGADLSMYTEINANKIKKACSKAANVWFLQWSGPFVVGLCHLLAAGFSYIFARTAPKFAEASAEPSQDSIVNIRSVLRRCILTVVLMLGFMYASASYVSGSAVNLSSAMLCLGACTIAATLGWMYLEIDLELLRSAATQGGLANNMMKIMRSDWSRAITVGGLNIFLPVMALLDMVRQKQRKALGVSSQDDMDKFTPGGRKVFNDLSLWNWCSILTKVDILAELCVALLIGMKITFVFFSWLNATLAVSGLNFWIQSVLVWAIGLGMFLCPIVPGSAVYLFAGIVLGAMSQVTAEPVQGPGFWVGVAIACVLSAIAKHMACVGQYMMGYFAGKSVKVQKFVGVDTVPTRAMEQILKKPGLALGKVAILVAGPDFPTSMMCGILKLNIPQMLLGTFPVVFVSIIPQVLVGALLTMDVEESQASLWGMISKVVTAFAASVQAGATLLFTYRIMKTVEVDGQKLAEYRPEHEAVAALTKQEAAKVAAFAQVSKWQVMSAAQMGTLLVSAIFFLMAGFIMMADFMLSDKFCFRAFSITNRIEDPYDLGGLNGSVLNLIILPAGWVALALSVIAFILHQVLSKMMARATEEYLKLQPAAVVNEQKLTEC
eukprot:TRINITY_DN21407_c0_g1_i2.p1 TRINITY_DN21407_c0_g1~~TRINITY_DN21407_c0_g1_i2.p1  ORF type:complete len:803 (-),score=175.43 TRINITY_DN21407_c0_g1_i2:51-2459(-)